MKNINEQFLESCWHTPSHKISLKLLKKMIFAELIVWDEIMQGEYQAVFKDFFLSADH